MRKWVVAGIVLASLCVVVVLALVNLNSLVNRNKDYLIGRVEEALGRNVTIGEVNVTLWKGIGLRLRSFVLSDDPAFSSGDFVRAKDLQINLKLVPLLRKELQVKSLILHDPSIQIIRSSDGQFNFSTIGREKKEKTKDRDSDDPIERKKKTRAWLISLVDVSGGQVRYVDRKEGGDLLVRAIDFRVRDLDLNQPFFVDLAAALFSEKQNLKAQTRVGPISGEGGFNNAPLQGKISIDPIDFGRLTTAVPAVRAALPKGLELGGIWKAKDVEFKGRLDHLAVKGTLEGSDGTLAFGKTLHKPTGVVLVLFAESQYAAQALSFREAKLKLHNLEISGKGEVKLGDAPFVNLSLRSNKVSLDGWEKMIPALQGYQLSGKVEISTTARGRVGKGTPQLQGTAILTGVSAKPPQFPQPIKDLNTRINFTGGTAELTETSLSLGNSEVRLSARIDRFSPLALTYKLSTTELRPADFQASLPPERKADVLKNVSSEGTLEGKSGAVAFQGKLASTEGILFRINYKELATGVVLENSIAHIRSLRVRALNGSLQAVGEYAYNLPVPRFSFAGKLQGIDLKEAYRSFDAKGTQDIQGRLNADMKVSGSGKGWEEIKPTLRGQGQAEVLEGALLNFNIAESVLSGITGVPGLTSLVNPQVRKKYPETFDAKDTEFKELKGGVTLADARVNVKDLRMTAAEYTVLGDGWVDFNRRVDFRCMLLLSQRLSADLAHSVREVRYIFNSQNQFEIPFNLNGTLPKVRPRPDSSYLAKMIQRGVVQRGAEELQRRIFGKKSAPPPSGGEANPVPESGSSEQKTEKKRSSREEMIRKGLEGLFGR